MKDCAPRLTVKNLEMANSKLLNVLEWKRCVRLSGA